MIKRSLKAKLIISYLAVALLTVLVVSVFIRATSGKQFLNLVTEQQASILKDEVLYYYEANGSLVGFFEYYVSGFADGNELNNGPASGANSEPYPAPNSNLDTEPNQQLPGQFPKQIRGQHGLVDTENSAIIPFLNYKIGDTVQEKDLKDKIAVEVEGETIAWIIPDKGIEFKYSAEEEVFLTRVNQAILYAACAGVIGAILMGIILAALFLKPIRNLMEASRNMAAGELEQSVPVQSEDELGQLSKTFNQMSADLASSDRQRRQLTADITHDLSTPLQVIAGYIEMLEDGEISLTPKQIQMMNSEIDLLRRLVNDLSMLSQADARDLQMQLVPVEPETLLERVHHAFVGIAKKEEISLEYNIAGHLPLIYVDEGRMIQVITNLVENAIRYTPKNGRILLSAKCEKGQVAIRVADNGSGIHPDDLPYVFDRFYRADKARDGNSGKMGLGLAISKALVTAQGGSIQVESTAETKGTTFILRFNPYQAGACDEKNGG
jgi:signal transduction histidine kinase